MELNTLCLVAIFAFAGIGIVAAIRSLVIGGWTMAVLAGITLYTMGFIVLSFIVPVLICVSIFLIIIHVREGS